jgi:chemotaxis protein methyltransferase CheR
MSPPSRSTAVGAAEVDRFRVTIARRLGLALEGWSVAALTELLGRRAAGPGGTTEAYLDRLASDRSWDEVRQLAGELTVTETYFFRNREQFHALAEVVLPQRMRARRAERRLRLLSVGCASGEEAYTLAMVVRDIAPGPAWRVSITGADVNGAALRQAESGRYQPWALRATPEPMRQRWFRPDGRTLVLHEDIRAAVRFVGCNVADDDVDLWRPGGYDAIFCRNVLMYLTRDSGDALVDRMVAALAPGGFLFLGHAESLRGRRDDLQVRHTHDTFYYERTGVGAAPSPDTAATGWPEDWMSAIGAATGRIRDLSDGRRQLVRPPATDVSTRDDWDRVVDLIGRERFAAALDVVESFPDGARDRPEALLLHAVVLIGCGRLDEAAAVCGRLLDRDAWHAGGHYLLGLCCESRGDSEGALHHHRRAAHLDPAFALPRLRLGILARRSGDRHAAHRELGRALTLLAHEDPHRLVLFAGGFTRYALIDLCRFELAACGVAA